MATTAWREITPEPRSQVSTIPLYADDCNCVLAELANLLQSHHFKASRRCSDFLDYVVRQALKGTLAQLKERALGVELFNRSADYDTNCDPVVRATAGEVRKKLAQHYQESKRGRAYIILPVGTYIPRFEIQVETPLELAVDEIEPRIDPHPDLLRIDTIPHKPSSLRDRILKKPRSLLAVAILGPALVATIMYFGHGQIVAQREAVQAQNAGTALATFWNLFVSPQADTVAVFSEVRHHSGPSPAGAINYPIGLSLGKSASPGISGVGEVMGVHALDEVFNSFHRGLRAKRSNFFTFDDASSENVIFVGSPLANPPLRLLQNSRNFVFQIVSTKSGEPALAIINNKPQPGEQKEFLSTPEELPIKDDYALISLSPGMRPDKRVLVLAGITTFGTQAAAEFVSRNDSIKSLLSHLKVSPGGDIEPFEAVISVKINDEVPVEERIVAVRQN
jgi:hypothetical protein